jgi:hypothetical protein
MTESQLLRVLGLDRRGFLRIGGLSVATTAILAACGPASEDAEEAAEEAEEQRPKGAQKDIDVLRTASSLEALAVSVYQMASDGGLLRTGAIGEAAKLFRSQHDEHAGLFQSATRKLGGRAFEAPNPVVMQTLQEPLGNLKTEADVARLARGLEMVLAATYQANVGQVVDKKLNATMMSVGAVEARHAALLSTVLGEPSAPKAFQPTEGAVTPGTGT